MRKWYWLSVLVTMGSVVGTFGPHAVAGERATTGIRFARHPAPSPDGREIAFSYHGDIWVVSSEGGTARRLTVHDAYDQLPVWSPDRRWIAFSSDRAGGVDIWVMPSWGGEAKRLTYHSAADYVCDWSPDGNGILFTSNRETNRTSAVYIVNVHTGRSRLIRADDFALANARFSADGRTVLCTRGGSWTRRLYRGSGVANLLMFPATGGAGRYLTHSSVNERWPMPDPTGKHVYYVTDRSGAPNLVRRPVSGGKETALTRFRDGSLFYPAMSRDGGLIAFERNFGLWVLNTSTGACREISVNAPSDYRANPDQRRQVADRITELAVGPDGRTLAFVAHGEVFLHSRSGEDALRLTETSQREEYIAFAPTGKSVAFVSDRTGEAQLYVLDVATRKVTQLTNEPRRPVAIPVFSPDASMVAFVRGASGSELCVAPAAGGDVRTLVSDPSISDIQWSPDGKWLAYTRSKSHSAGSIADVFVVRVDEPKPVNVTCFPAVNSDPVWAPDGKKLFFLSNRSQVRHVYSVSLIEEEGREEEGAERPEQTERPYELTRVHLRARRITSGDSSVTTYALTPDGKSIVFCVAQLDGTDLWRVSATGGNATRLTRTGEPVSSLKFSKDGSALYYLSRGVIRRLALTGAEPRPETVRPSGTIVIDTRAELLQLFDEAWRKMRDSFYDPRMHGCDWEDVRQRYRPVVTQIGTREEFYALFNIALGELNASHCGISPPSDASGPVTASLGVVLDENYEGPGVRVLRAVPRGPADTSSTRIAAGEIIVKLGETPVRHNEHLYQLLEDRSGKDVLITVQSSDGKERVVRMRPVTGARMRELLYEEWTEQRREQVNRLSGGRLQYVHLPAMGAVNLERFRRAALSEMDGKDGLIVDLRFNSGGSIADEMFSIIQNRLFGWRTIRDDPALSPAPLPAFTQPFVVLVNEASFSNAEVFAWGCRALGVGKIVGMPTYGGVIGTGSTTLIDGSRLRMPAVGSFTLNGRNMENNGCPPHVRVEHMPEDIVAGRDRQLETAVAELLKQVRRKPSTPKGAVATKASKP